VGAASQHPSRDDDEQVTGAWMKGQPQRFIWGHNMRVLGRNRIGHRRVSASGDFECNRDITSQSVIGKHLYKMSVLQEP
jgi:hypothetical protein